MNLGPPAQGQAPPPAQGQAPPLPASGPPPPRQGAGPPLGPPPPPLRRHPQSTLAWPPARTCLRSSGKGHGAPEGRGGGIVFGVLGRKKLFSRPDILWFPAGLNLSPTQWFPRQMSASVSSGESGESEVLPRAGRAPPAHSGSVANLLCGAFRSLTTSASLFVR